MELNFSDIWLKKLKAKDKREEYRDKATQGLLLRSSPSGVKSFSFYYRFGSKTARVTIGKYPDINLRTARAEADALRRLVAQNIDPRFIKKDLQVKREMTVALMVEAFIENYAKPKNKSWKQAENNLRLYLVKYQGATPIKDVTRSDIHLILDELVQAQKYAAANRALTHIKKFFGWLVEMDYLDYSPADHIKPKAKEKKRERVLSDHELKALWHATEAMSAPYKAWVQLLMLCGQRRLETAHLTRSQIEEDRWHLSSEDTKNAKPHIIPLPLQAQKIIQSLLVQEDEHLLRSGRNGDAPINGFSKAKVQMDKLSGIDDWKFHDIRRTVATNLSKLGTDRFIIQKIINHSDGSVTAIYDRYSYLDEKREALQKWADKLDEIIK